MICIALGSWRAHLECLSRIGIRCFQLQPCVWCVACVYRKAQVHICPVIFNGVLIPGLGLYCSARPEDRHLPSAAHPLYFQVRTIWQLPVNLRASPNIVSSSEFFLRRFRGPGRAALMRVCRGTCMLSFCSPASKISFECRRCRSWKFVDRASGLLCSSLRWCQFSIIII